MSAAVTDLMNAYGVRRLRLTSLLAFNDHDGENNFVNTTLALTKMPSAPMFDVVEIAAALPDLAAQSTTVAQAMNALTTLAGEFAAEPWRNSGHRWENPEEHSERERAKTDETVAALQAFQAAERGWLEASKHLGLLET